MKIKLNCPSFVIIKVVIIINKEFIYFVKFHDKEEKKKLFDQIMKKVTLEKPHFCFLIFAEIQIYHQSKIFFYSILYLLQTLI